MWRGPFTLVLLVSSMALLPETRSGPPAVLGAHIPTRDPPSAVGPGEVQPHLESPRSVECGICSMLVSSARRAVEDGRDVQHLSKVLQATCFHIELAFTQGAGLPNDEDSVCKSIWRAHGTTILQASQGSQDVEFLCADLGLCPPGHGIYHDVKMMEKKKAAARRETLNEDGMKVEL
eukprot:GILJ01003275.1.p1 GENE.GILJ01003275.1~~GILJ01003275.1.p1  ORF type:complete len:177 (+),score=11.99 GILJ01003275.1:48-578(+)